MKLPYMRMILSFNHYIIKPIFLLLLIGYGQITLASPIKKLLEYLVENNQELVIAETNYKTSFSNFMPNIGAEFK